MSNNATETRRTWTETVEVAGGEVVDKLKEIVEAGNARRIILRNGKDDRLIEIPLTAGVAAGAAVLVAVGAVAALLTRVKVEIVRHDDREEQQAQPLPVPSAPVHTTGSTSAIVVTQIPHQNRLRFWSPPITPRSQKTNSTESMKRSRR